GRRAGSPAAHLVTYGDAAWSEVEISGVPGDSVIEVRSGLRDQPVLQAPRGKRWIAGNHELTPVLLVFCDGHDRAALQATDKMDRVRYAPQWNFGAMGERDRGRQAPEPRLHPIGMS